MGIIERKEREKEQRREEILDAAQKIFFAKGLQTATMDEIAEAAELSKGTLYLYYKSKEDLYLAVHIRGDNILADMFEKALSTGEPTVKLLANVADAYYEFFQTQRDYFRTFTFFETPQFHLQVSEEMLNTCNLSNQRVWTLILNFLQRAKAEGVVGADYDPGQMMLILWSYITGLMRQIDNNSSYWTDIMNINLDQTLHLSKSILLEFFLTEKGKEEFRHYRQLREVTKG
jgi:AcrR family transcriptional regulator